MFAPQSYRRICDDSRKPLARYGAMTDALRKRVAPLLHHPLGHDQDHRRISAIFLLRGRSAAKDMGPKEGTKRPVRRLNQPVVLTGD
jgi:hypothetical protein